MAQINFLAGEGFTIQDLGGSGLGFYGPGGFGQSVQVGAYQDNTYITDATGAIEGPKTDNIKWAAANSGMIPTADVRVLRDIPNYLATLNIRFSNSTPVQAQNVQVRIFDRTNIDAPASGVTTKVAQLIHPWNTQSPSGSGDTAWWSPGGSGGSINGRIYDNPVMLANSPGLSGLMAGGSVSDTTHDWYLAISASPDSIGSKTLYGLFTSLEYL